MKTSIPKIEIICNGSGCTDVLIDGNPIGAALRKISYIHDANENDGLPIVTMEFVGCEVAINANVYPQISEDIIETVCFHAENKVRECLANLHANDALEQLQTKDTGHNDFA